MSKQRKTNNPTGAGKKQALRVAFDSRLKLEFHGSKVTSDAGLLAYREPDEALGLTELGDDLLNDWRTGKNTQPSMVTRRRQSIFSRLAGYEDTNDAERLSVDPTRQTGGAVLQPAWHGGAVDQGGQERRQMDANVLSRLCGQSSAAATVRVGLQPGQLSAASCVAPGGASLDTDDIA